MIFNGRLRADPDAGTDLGSGLRLEVTIGEHDSLLSHGLGRLEGSVCRGIGHLGINLDRLVVQLVQDARVDPKYIAAICRHKDKSAFAGSSDKFGAKQPDPDLKLRTFLDRLGRDFIGQIADVSAGAFDDGFGHEAHPFIPEFLHRRERVSTAGFIVEGFRGEIKRTVAV